MFGYEDTPTLTYPILFRNPNIPLFKRPKLCMVVVKTYLWFLLNSKIIWDTLHRFFHFHIHTKLESLSSVSHLGNIWRPLSIKYVEDWEETIVLIFVGKNWYIHIKKIGTTPPSFIVEVHLNKIFCACPCPYVKMSWNITCLLHVHNVIKLCLLQSYEAKIEAEMELMTSFL